MFGSKAPFPASIFQHPPRTHLEVRALGRLGQLLVGGRGHVPPDLDQDSLHGEVAFPGCYAGEFGEVDLSVVLDSARVLVREYGRV